MFPIKNKKLFLKYALPCGQVLVERNEVSQETLDSLKEKTLKDKEITEDLASIFKIGVGMCSVMAKKLGKNEIDEETIRKYFWYMHDDALNWRCNFYNDIDLKKCQVIPGRIISTDPVTAETPFGNINVKQDFQKVEENDFVVIHYDYIIEKIQENEFKKMWGIKKKL